MNCYKVQSIIKISGFLHRDPKVNDDGSVELIIKVPVYDESTIKGKEQERKLAHSTFYVIHVSRKQWSNLKKVNNLSHFLISGVSKGSVNNKGIPYITVYCTDIVSTNPPKANDSEYCIEHQGMKEIVKNDPGKEKKLYQLKVISNKFQTNTRPRTYLELPTDKIKIYYSY